MNDQGAMLITELTWLFGARSNCCDPDHDLVLACRICMSRCPFSTGLATAFTATLELWLVDDANASIGVDAQRQK